MTPYQREVLADVVMDPDAWWDHAQKYAQEKYAQDQASFDALMDKLKSGQQADPRQVKKLEDALKVTAEARALAALEAKVARWAPEYERKKAGAGYKNRMEREGVEAQQ